VAEVNGKGGTLALALSREAQPAISGERVAHHGARAGAPEVVEVANGLI